MLNRPAVGFGGFDIVPIVTGSCELAFLHRQGLDLSAPIPVRGGQYRMQTGCRFALVSNGPRLHKSTVTHLEEVGYALSEVYCS